MNNAFNNVTDLGQCETDSYRLLYCATSVGDPVGVLESREPDEIKLQIFPNPAVNNTMTVNFTLDKPSKVYIYMYDMKGNNLELISNEYYQQGNNMYEYPVKHFVPGLYVIRLVIENNSYDSKFIIAK